MTNKLKPADKCVKKSISFPPKMWKWIEGRKGDVGVASKVVQLAVQTLMDENKPEKPGPPRASGCVQNAPTPSQFTVQKRHGKIK